MSNVQQKVYFPHYSFRKESCSKLNAELPIHLNFGGRKAKYFLTPKADLSHRDIRISYSFTENCGKQKFVAFRSSFPSL